MALTQTEQVELDRLNAKQPFSPQIAPQSPQVQTPTNQQTRAVQLPTGQQGGLTATEQAELDQLNTKQPFQAQQPATQQLDPRQQRIDQLLGQIGKNIPLAGPERLPIAAGGPGPLSRVGQLSQQQQAFQELQNMGFSREDIGSALAVRAGTKQPSTLPRMIGATIGGVAALGLGAFIPGPEEAFTVPAGIKIGAEIVGAGLGGATGAGLQAAADPDTEFTFKEFARVFGEEAAFEALGIGATSGLRKLLGGAAKTLTPEVSRLSAQLAGAGKRAGVKGRRVITRGGRRAQMRFLPATFSQNQIIDTLQGIGEGSLVGSNTIFQFKRGIRKSVVQLQKELVEDFTEGTAKRGTLAASTVLFDTLKGNRTAWSKAGGMLYRTLDDEGVEVSMKGLQRFTKGQWDLILETGEIAGDPKLNAIFRRAGTKLPPSSSFEASHLLRSKLLSIERAAKKGITPKPNTARIARDMINEITSSMETAAKVRPGLFKQYRRAADFWRAGSKRFDNDIVRGLTRKLRNHPQLAALAVFHPNTAQEIKLVRKAAGEKAFKEMRGAWLEQLLKDSASKEVGEEGVLMGTEFLNKFGNMGDETLDAIFTKREIATIEDLAKTAAFAQQKTGGVGGSLKIVQGIAAFSLVASPLLPEGNFRGITRGTAGVILLGPAVIARMMTNPLSAKLLSEGFKARIGTRQGIALTARLIRDVIKTRSQLNSEEIQRDRRITQETRRAGFREQQTQRRLKVGRTIPIAPQRFRTFE